MVCLPHTHIYWLTASTDVLFNPFHSHFPHHPHPFFILNPGAACLRCYPLVWACGCGTGRGWIPSGRGSDCPPRRQGWRIDSDYHPHTTCSQTPHHPLLPLPPQNRRGRRRRSRSLLRREGVGPPRTCGAPTTASPCSGTPTAGPPCPPYIYQVTYPNTDTHTYFLFLTLTFVHRPLFSYDYNLCLMNLLFFSSFGYACD